jgi:hypothetical protein
MILLYFFVLLMAFVICGFLLIFFLIQFIAEFTTDAPFVPIPTGIEEKILGNLKMDNESILYDLGCGDGKVLLSAAKRFPNTQMVGVEVAFFPYILARLKTRAYPNIRIERGNIFKTDLGNATHVFLYLYPQVLEKLLPLLEQKCKKGTRIVSCDFEDKNRTASEIIELDSLAKRGKKLIVYTI